MISRELFRKVMQANCVPATEALRASGVEVSCSQSESTESFYVQFGSDLEYKKVRFSTHTTFGIFLTAEQIRSECLKSFAIAFSALQDFNLRVHRLDADLVNMVAFSRMQAIEIASDQQFDCVKRVSDEIVNKAGHFFGALDLAGLISKKTGNLKTNKKFEVFTELKKTVFSEIKDVNFIFNGIFCAVKKGMK